MRKYPAAHEADIASISSVIFAGVRYLNASVFVVAKTCARFDESNTIPMQSAAKRMQEKNKMQVNIMVLNRPISITKQHEHPSRKSILNGSKNRAGKSC